MSSRRALADLQTGQTNRQLVPTPASFVTKGTPSILAVAEMNLEEYPAFRLGRRSKRPELRYARTRTDAGGRVLEQVWVVRGAEGLGLPGPFEQDLYVALLVLFTEQGLPSDGRIRFTRNRLAQVMGCSNSGRGYELLEQGLSRLAGATIHTEHAFYRPGTIGRGGEREGPAERLSLDFHILEEVRVYERRSAGGDFAEEHAGAMETASRDGPPVERARPMELSVARLGLPLVQSYERRYTKGLDTTFYFALTRPLGKRLYRYLDKVRNGRGSFEIGVRALADVLGLEYRYPSDIKDGLAEAHVELRETGYLATAAYAPLAGGPGAGEKVVYGLDPAFDRRPRKRAGAVSGRAQPQLQPQIQSEALGSRPAGQGAAAAAGVIEEIAQAALDEARTEAQAALAAAQPRLPEKLPLQAELEELGVSPGRAAALVARYPAAHVAARIAYVRGLLHQQSGMSGGPRNGQRRLQNPAGFLAKAIEEGYAVPPAPASAATAVPPQVDAPPAAAPARGGAQDRAAAPAAHQDSGLAPEAAGTAGGVGASDEGADTAPAIDTPGAPGAGVWARLAAALKERVSGATYASFVAPARAVTQDDAPHEDAPQVVMLEVASGFALERWHRPPLAPALADAAAALGVKVTLRLKEPGTAG